MKTKILILLPIIFTVGILLGHLMQTLAWTSSSQPNPGHPASQISGDNDADRTFYSTGKYTFQGDLNVNGKLITNNDQICPTGWNCQIKTWDLVAQSGQFYGDLNVRYQLRLGPIDAGNEGGEIYWAGAGSNQNFIMDRYSNTLRIFIPDGAELMSIDSSGNLNVGGTIKGWNVPSEIIFTSVHSGGAFGKWKGMHDWIQNNGCSGYHVCNEFEVLAFIETGKTINWGSVSTQIGAIYTLNENCDQWTTNAGIGWRGTVWTINNQFGLENCGQNFRVLCCK